MPTYSDLHAFWNCPRAFAYGCVLGYSKPVLSPAMTTGILAHEGIVAHLRNENYKTIMVELVDEQRRLILQYTRVEDKWGDELRKLDKAYKRALPLADRYIHAWLPDYMPALMVEPELKLGDVVCHPDLITLHNRQVTIVDFKTSKSPDPRWYDMSGQLDLYAYVYNQLYPSSPALMVSYDVISEDGIFRHDRPPRLDVGERFANSISEIAHFWKHPSEVFFHPHGAVNCPHSTFSCPNRCSFFIPCWFVETGDVKGSWDYLERNYVKEKKDA